MRIFFTFFVVVLVVTSSHTVSQGQQQNICGKGFVQIFKPNNASIKSCVTPEVAERFSALGWQTVGETTSPNIAEVAKETLNTESSEEVSDSKETTLPPESAIVRTFVIVPEESKASYIVDEEFLGGALEKLDISPGPVTAVGTTQQVEGHMQINSEDLTDPQFLGSNSFTVNIESLTSDDERRDDRIKEHNLESTTYPLATFIATSVEGAPAEYAQGEEVKFQLLGDLTVREITIPSTFEVTAILSDIAIEGKMSTNLQMTDFGFDPPDWAGIRTVENDFIVEIEFKMLEQ